jgi:hypothetical protein
MTSQLLHSEFPYIRGKKIFSFLSVCKRQVSYCTFNKSLKGPKEEKCVSGIFAQITPVWIGELETRPKASKINVGAFYFYFYQLNFVLAMSATALKIFFV